MPFRLARPDSPFNHLAAKVRAGAALCAALLALSAATSPSEAVGADPRRPVEELFAADRSFSAAAAKTDLIAALSNMFADDVTMVAPGGLRRGRGAAIEALRANPLNAGARAQWSPAGGGVSSDGRQGFTFGYMNVTRADGSAAPAKYVAYWVKSAAGWRVVAYKRAPRPAGEVSTAMLPPSLPTPGLARGDAAAVRRYTEELRAAEVGFSNDAGVIGLGPAFFKHGSPDAVNVGGPEDAEFVRGPEAISKRVGGGPEVGGIKWGPDHLVVASTGDLGVSLGTIVITAKPAEGKPAETREVPFLTVWKRATPRDAWRYAAE